MGLFVVMTMYYAHQSDKSNNEVIKLNADNLRLSNSLANVQSDNQLIALSLESEVLLRESLELTIKTNSEGFTRYIESLELAVKNEETKVKSLKEIIKELPNENCINSTMPNSVIGLFNNTAN